MKPKTTVARQYPRDVWVLSPAYVVKQVTVVQKAWPGSPYEYGDKTREGKTYQLECMHATKADAIAYGRKLIASRREFLAKQQVLLTKREATLAKAEKAA